MSTRTRRKKPATGQTPALTTTPAVTGMQPTPMPTWHWRTFPVYFAFSVGGFLGLYMGIIAAGLENSTQNSTVLTICFGFWAILVGFGFSRLTSRWMMSKGWARPRSARKK